MNSRNDGSDVIDSLIRFLIAGGAIATIVVAPGMASVIDMPLRKHFDAMDKNRRAKELRRTLYYMKQRGLITLGSEGYEHGITVTKKGSRRLEDRDFERLAIATQSKWDKKWRLVFFDIPEQHRAARRQLIGKLKQLGFEQLQRIVWVHPYSCRVEVELVTRTYEVEKYVSYIEATSIDAEHLLIKRFRTTGIL